MRDWNLQPRTCGRSGYIFVKKVWFITSDVCFGVICKSSSNIFYCSFVLIDNVYTLTLNFAVENV